MKKLQESIDNLIDRIGYLVSHLVIIMVFLVIITLFLRYVLNIGNIALQELVMYFHAIFFMFGIAYAIKENSHVKIDILSNQLHQKQKDVIFILGIIFLMIPFSLFTIYISMDMVIKSWEIMEQSGEAGGLNLVYILKSIIPISGFLILLQSFSELIKKMILIMK